MDGGNSIGISKTLEEGLKEEAASGSTKTTTRTRRRQEGEGEVTSVNAVMTAAVLLQLEEHQKQQQQQQQIQQVEAQQGMQHQQISQIIHQQTGQSLYDRVTSPATEATLYGLHHNQQQPHLQQQHQPLPPPNTQHPSYFSVQQSPSSSSSFRVPPILNPEAPATAVPASRTKPLVIFGKLAERRHPQCVDEAELRKKRERNRLAATKCRQRKLEKINKLEGKVARLHEENDNLVRERSRLAHQLSQLRAQLAGHLEQGCPLQMAFAVGETNFDPSMDGMDAGGVGYKTLGLS